MIVVRASDRTLARALRTVAHPEEDVVVEARVAADALAFGFPRLLIRAGEHAGGPRPPGLSVLDLDAVTLRRWEADRRARDVPEPREVFLASRLAPLILRSPSEATWVDRALADLGRAAGARLPAPLRGFARRVFEFPIRYRTLHDVSEACDISRGALKARFRRKELDSPYTYLRWFRTLAVADLLSDRSVTVAAAAHRMGFTSDGNLCRMMGALTGLTPTEVRTARGWNRLLAIFAWQHLSPTALERWRELDDLFVRRVA